MDKEIATLEIFKVHSSFKIDFQVIIHNDISSKFQNPVNKFTIDGNTYLRVVPASYLIIDIQTKKEKKNFNPYGTFSLTKKHVYILIIKLKKIMRKIRDPKLEMFFLYEGVLTVDENKAKEAEETISVDSVTHNIKQLHIIPSVVEDSNERYEGVKVYINTIDNFTYLTFTEIDMVIDVLSKVDFSLLSLKLLNTYLLMKNEEAKELNLHRSPLIEQSDEEIHNESVVTRKEEAVIPEI